ncbi:MULTISPECIES: DUF5666 domain-containing protein [unclassified Sinorhizobium]|uniref:DUF5666 domain-containing protein n=1 Tax=unclassified Sinorhizobium TaxID=2613772 RepID=UPI0035257F64
MTSSLSRRKFLLQIAAFQFTAATGALARNSSPHDHGIGGTGHSGRVGKGGGEDHGIGGTGIFGTIQGFGSVIVNDVHVPYTDTTPIFIDGRRVQASAMRVGQIARILLKGKAAQSISITSEVVGKIDRLNRSEMTILSQSIDLREVGPAGLRKGQVVAVFGIRKPDGTIVARRIESRAVSNVFHVRGVPSRVRGRVLIGGLQLEDRYARFVGKQVLVRVKSTRNGPFIADVAAEDVVPGLRRGLVNVETYGRRENARVRLGVGIQTTVGMTGVPRRDAHMFVDLSIRGANRFGEPRSGTERPGNRPPPRSPDRGPPDDWNGGPPPGFPGDRGMPDRPDGGPPGDPPRGPPPGANRPNRGRPERP